MAVKQVWLYAKTDYDIIRLFELVAKQDEVSFSEMVSFAVEHYVQHGSYIKIGAVQEYQYEGSFQKNIYVREDSLFYRWLEDGKTQRGFKATKRIKAILQHSIDITTDAESIISLYDMSRLLKQQESSRYFIPSPQENRIATLPLSQTSQTVEESTMNEKPVMPVVAPIKAKLNTEGKKVEPSSALNSQFISKGLSFD